MKIKISSFLSEEKTDRQALQEMFDSVPVAARNVTFDLEGLDFKLDGTVFWKKDADRITTILGHGSTITAEGDFPILTGDKGKGFIVGYKGEDNDIMRWMDKVRIYGVKFVGGSTQLELVGTSQSKIVDCHFLNGEIGLKGVFALQTNIEQCFFQFQSKENCLLLTGAGDPITGEERYLTNGSTTNSQCNRSVVRDCRFFNKERSGASVPFACVRTMGNDGVKVENCVFEGAPAKYPIYHDRQGSNTVVSFKVVDPHIEYSGYEKRGLIEAMIYAHGGVEIVIEGMYCQTGEILQLDCDASGSGCVHVIRPLYVFAGNKGLKMGKNERWKIVEPADQNIWLEESSWVDGKVPAQITVSKGLNMIGYASSPNLMVHTTGGRIGMQSLDDDKNLNRVWIGGHKSSAEYMVNIKRILDYGSEGNDFREKDLSEMESKVMFPVLLMNDKGRYAYLPLVGNKPKE